MKNLFEPFGLGDRVKDSVTGQSGIVVCVTTWLHGCIRIGVQPEKLKDDKPVDAIYFDQSQLVLVKRGVHEPQTLAVRPPTPPIVRRSAGGPGRETSGFSR